MPVRQKLKISELLRTGISIADAVLKFRDKPPELFSEKLGAAHSGKDVNNQTRRIDMAAQYFAEFLLMGEFGDQIHVAGEEKGPYPESFDGGKLIAVIDPIDGTDLFARGFSNWCCSLAFFDPQKKKILASIVGHSSGDIYFASPKGAFKRTADHRIIPLNVDRDRGTDVETASVCFYGQKPRALLSVVDNRHIMQMLAGLRTTMRSQKLDFRIYNFAGNPMMAKIPSGAVDIVFELSGQEVHDVIPGAYIAVQAGAVIINLNGGSIDLDDSMNSPRQKLQYILASNAQLASAFQSALSGIKKSRAVPKSDKKMPPSN